MHFMSGNLSFQIEHHLFPDLPSNRYQEIAPKVAGAVRALRADLHHRLAAAPGRLGVEEGVPAVAAQRLRTQGDNGDRGIVAGHRHACRLRQAERFGRRGVVRFSRSSLAREREISALRVNVGRDLLRLSAVSSHAKP